MMRDRACEQARVLARRLTAFTFAERGSSAVVFADLNIASAREAAAKSKTFATHPEYNTIAVQVDVRDRASVKAAIDVVLHSFGRLDFCCNCAGVSSLSLVSLTPHANFS